MSMDIERGKQTNTTIHYIDEVEPFWDFRNHSFEYTQEIFIQPIAYRPSEAPKGSVSKGFHFSRSVHPHENMNLLSLGPRDGQGVDIFIGEQTPHYG